MKRAAAAVAATTVACAAAAGTLLVYPQVCVPQAADGTYTNIESVLQTDIECARANGAAALDFLSALAGEKTVMGAVLLCIAAIVVVTLMKLKPAAPAPVEAPRAASVRPAGGGVNALARGDDERCATLKGVFLMSGTYGDGANGQKEELGDVYAVVFDGRGGAVMQRSGYPIDQEFGDAREIAEVKYNAAESCLKFEEAFWTESAGTRRAARGRKWSVQILDPTSMEFSGKVTPQPKGLFQRSRHVQGRLLDISKMASPAEVTKLRHLLESLGGQSMASTVRWHHATMMRRLDERIRVMSGMGYDAL